MPKDEEKKVFRLHGLTCASCARKFEENVQSLPGVTSAKVNFGAAKLILIGNATLEELEKAGEFDQIKVSQDHTPQENIPFWKKRDNQWLFLSLLFLLAGFLANAKTTEGSFLSISCYFASMVVGGWRLFRQGLLNLIRLQFDMKTLMTIAIVGAAAIGEWGEGATVVILFAISEALESYSMERARKSIYSLMEIAPKHAFILQDGEIKEVPVEEIRVHDRMIVKPGQKIAMDGIVVKGKSTVDQSSITGESLPVTKEEGDEVFAGTFNQEGALEVQVTKRVEDTTFAKIVQLVEEAQAKRAPAQTFIDRFAKYYTPVILFVGFLLAVVPPLFWGDWQEWIYRGLSVLVVGCPCALVISTPVAIVTAIGNAARYGVLIKGGLYLEELRSIRKIAFDKTGTLTEGKPKVTDWLIVGDARKEKTIQYAYALEKKVQHPLAYAILQYGEEHRGNESLEIEEFQSLTGKGVQARIDGENYYIGSTKLWRSELLASLQEKIEQLQGEGKTVVLFGSEHEVQALIAIADPIRTTSKEILPQLAHLGIRETVMLTGDNQKTAEKIADQLGIQKIEAELLPDEKLQTLQTLTNDGSKVAMVGDGVNDAPALAAASVGIAMGGAGSDTALETADIVLMGDDLRKIPFLIRLSRKTIRIIKQNIFFALGLKLLALLLIIPGLLTLWLAVFADMGGTLMVMLNALRLLSVKANAE